MKNILLIILFAFLSLVLTSCYTRVATNGSDDYIQPIVIYVPVPAPPPPVYYPNPLPYPHHPYPHPKRPVYKHRQDDNRNNSHHPKRDKLRNSGGRNQSGGRR